MAPRIFHTMAGLVLNLVIFTEEPDILLFPDLFIKAGLEAALVERSWDTALDSSLSIMYADTSTLLQRQKIVPIVGWEAVVNILD